jgi:hypothetical protein
MQTCENNQFELLEFVQYGIKEERAGENRAEQFESKL